LTLTITPRATMSRIPLLDWRARAARWAAAAMAAVAGSEVVTEEASAVVEEALVKVEAGVSKGWEEEMVAGLAARAARAARAEGCSV